MKHSVPSLYGFLALESAMIAYWAYLGGPIWGAYCYEIVGFFIWIACSCEPSLWRLLLFWWPAILLDRPEWCEKPR